MQNFNQEEQKDKESISTSWGNDESESSILNANSKSGASPSEGEFYPKKKQIKDEFINMDFLSKFSKVNVTEDGGVQKFIDEEEQDTILNSTNNTSEDNKANLDDYPSDGARVVIAFEGRTLSGELIEKQRPRKELKSFKLFNDDVIKGLHHAASTLKEKETSWFQLAPEYHYGKMGVEGIIPPDTDIYYKVTMEQFKNVKKAFENTDYNGRITFVQENKEDGNLKYKNGNLDDALKKYKRALNVISTFPKVLVQVMDVDQKEEQKLLQLTLLNNIAQVYLKKRNFVESKQAAKQALQIRKDNIKAKFRFGQSLMGLGSFKEAIKEFQECEALDQDYFGYQNLIQECKGKIVQQVKQEKQVYKGIFNKLGQDEEKESSRKKIIEKIERKRKRIENEKNEVGKNEKTGDD